MTADLTYSNVPAPRATNRAVRTPEAVHAAVYGEFLYGIGAAPGLDLGAPVHYRRDGDVFRHEFERGVTFANVGTAPAEITLDPAYRDLTGARRDRMVLAPHTAAVLLADA
jgi:hypothetical protein